MRNGELTVKRYTSIIVKSVEDETQAVPGVLVA